MTLQLARTELAQSYEVGLIQQTPVPELAAEDQQRLAGLARRAWSLRRSLDTAETTSHAFVLPALLQAAGTTITERAAAWAGGVGGTEAELGRIQEEVFWVEGPVGKWRPRAVDSPTVERLIAERTSAAVKEALASLLSAPPPGAGRVGGRRRPRGVPPSRRSSLAVR